MEDETAADADANEAASLMRWLSFYAVQSQERRVSTVRGLLQTAFPDALIASSKTKDDWSDVVTTLESFYEVQLAIDTVKLSTAEDSSDETLRVVLELALGAVVQCEAKATFVRDILKMNDSVQTDLMAVIEKVMAREVPILKSDDAHQENAAKSQQGESAELFSGNEKEDVNETSNSDSRLYLSRNAALQRATRENDILKDENIHLARDLENAGKKLSDTEMANRELVSTIQQLREQLDVDVLRKERSLRALYDKQMHSLQHELDAAKVELRDKTVLTSEVSALRDEVDLLRPLAEKMTKVDSTVARYKAKIDELSGAKERLQRVEDTNAELVKKNLALETEITIAASWQRKLNEAKEENTVVEFRVSELQTLLAREREEHSLIRTELEIAQNSLKETSALNELRGAAEQQLSWVSAECNVFSALTMSGGISEFNPELMQKIARLEYENAELKKQIDGETSARIDTLLDEIEKLSRLKRSFEKKYFDTDRALQSTQHQLRRAKQQLASTITEFQVAVRLQTERQVCLQEDVASYALERQILDDERTRLQTQLHERKEQEEVLTRALDTQELELSTLQESIETLTTQKDAVVDQLHTCVLVCEDLKLDLQQVKRDCASRITRHIETVAMQVEDANAERLRLQDIKTRELNDMRRRYEKNAAEAISRMTLLVEAKSCEIEKLSATIRNDKLLHDKEQRKLEAAHQVATQELEKYQELHSVSNADWKMTEEKLGDRIRELEKLCSSSKQQEVTLKSTIKRQLESNKRLVDANRALKSDVGRKGSKIQELENAVVVLEAKVILLEKERNHVSTQEQRKRGAKDEILRFSSQLNTQVSLMITELEKVLKENKELQTKCVKCNCSRGSPSRSEIVDSGQKAKKFYLRRIQQLEHEKETVEYKRREILLANAKLIQEQKQLHVKNVCLANEVSRLQESINHWLLRDERRKKKADLSRSQKNATVATCEEANPDEEVQRQQGEGWPGPSTGHAYGTNDSSPQENSAPPSSKATPVSTLSRKRRCDQAYSTSEAPTEVSAREKLADRSREFTDVTDFSSSESQPAPPERRPKRRLTHFITRQLASERTQQRDTEKPSECHQQ